MDVRETILRKITPIIINSYNQPFYLKNIIKKFSLNRMDNIFVLDNNSSSPDLLEYYKTLSANNIQIIYYNNNRGPRYFHYEGVYKLFESIPHIYTDPDIDFDILPDNFLSVLYDLSKKYSVAKVGCALEIPLKDEIKDNIFFSPPDKPGEKFSVSEWESRFWVNKLEENVYQSPVDTTLHLFNPSFFSDRSLFISGIRVAQTGFVVKHLPWYKNDQCPQIERDYYKTTSLENITNF